MMQCIDKCLFVAYNKAIMQKTNAAKEIAVESLTKAYQATLPVMTLKFCALVLWRALLAAALFAALMTPNWGTITLVGAIAGLILVADLSNFGGGWSRYTGLSLAPRMVVNGTGFLMRGPWLELFYGIWLYTAWGAWSVGAAFFHPLAVAAGAQPMSAAVAQDEWQRSGYLYEGLLTWLPIISALAFATLLLLLLALPARLRLLVLAAPLATLPARNQEDRPAYTNEETDEGGRWEQQQSQYQEQVQPREQPQPHAAQARSGPAQKTYANPARKAKFSFGDVLGMDDLKAKLLKAYKQFQIDGGNGIVLYGEPGNGKTFIAQALAGELGFKYMEVTAADVTSKWMGESAERMDAIFADACAQAPVVLFFDEVESFLSSRANMIESGQGGDRDDHKTANTFLTAVSDLNKGFKNHGVLLMAATNFIEGLDEGGTRDGRFDCKIMVPTPDLAARRHLFLMGVKSVDGARIDRDSLEVAFKRWEGWSVARIQKIARLAKIAMLEDRSLRLNFDLVRRVIDEDAEGSGTRVREDAKRLHQLAFPLDLSKRIDKLVRSLQNPEKLAEMGVKAPRGAIFTGPAGTGKTATATALAKATGMRIVMTSGSALLAKRDAVKDVIKVAKNVRPCIVFIDEAESVLRARTSNPYGPEVTNQLLVYLDGADALHDVFFVAATNTPLEEMDTAVLREGRFSEHLDFTPDYDSLLRATKDFVQSKGKSVQWKGNIDQFVARHLEGGSPAKLGGMIDDELRGLVGEDNPVVDLDSI